MPAPPHPGAERAAYDYAADGLHCKLSPQPPAVLQPRRHLQLGDGYVVESDVSWVCVASSVADRQTLSPNKQASKSA